MPRKSPTIAVNRRALVARVERALAKQDRELHVDRIGFGEFVLRLGFQRGDLVCDCNGVEIGEIVHCRAYLVAENTRGHLLGSRSQGPTHKSHFFRYVGAESSLINGGC